MSANFTMGQQQLGGLSSGLVDNFHPIAEQLSETNYNSNGHPNQAIEFINQMEPASAFQNTGAMNGPFSERKEMSGQ